MKRLLLCLACTALLTGCATTGGRAQGCTAYGPGALLLSGLATAGWIAASIVTGNSSWANWAFIGGGGSGCVAAAQAEDMTPLNAGTSDGPDRPTVPEPGGQESF